MKSKNPIGRPNQGLSQSRKYKGLSIEIDLLLKMKAYKMLTDESYTDQVNNALREYLKNK